MEQETKPMTLIIPDVHGRMFWRSAVKKHPELPTVFLGDYLDPYTYIDGILPSEALVELREILRYKQENSDRVTLFLGNHDVHYFDSKLNSSRKDWLNQDELKELFTKHISCFRLIKSLSSGGKNYLFSHAGIIPEWLQLYFPNLDTSNLDSICYSINDKLNDIDVFKSFVKYGLMDISGSRCGSAKYPSMVWADVQDHMYQEERLPNVYQIFGHTQLESGPIITKDYACLDCRRAFLLLEDGSIIDA